MVRKKLFIALALALILMGATSLPVSALCGSCGVASSGGTWCLAYPATFQICRSWTEYEGGFDENGPWIRIIYKRQAYVDCDI